MKLIVDTNIIFSALIRDSITRYILFHSNAELFTIGFSHIELQKYKREIVKKSGASSEAIDMLLQRIMAKIAILDDKMIDSKFQEAYVIMKDIDIKDTPFLAAALTINADIWSDDKHFEKQKKVKVWKTQDIIRLIYK